MVAKYALAEIDRQDKPRTLVKLDDDAAVGSNKPDMTAEQTVIVALKARPHLITRGVIGAERRR